jgi:thiol-disulfide isomerase/thioredoxin
MASAASAADRPSPDCHFAMADGRQVDLSALRGKVVYLDFWASWCTSCLASFPFMDGLQRDLKTAGLDVIAVNLDAKPADATRFLSRRHIGFPVALGDNQRCARQFNVGSMPSTYLIDKLGNIRAVHSGFSTSDAKGLRAIVAQLLGEKA